MRGPEEWTYEDLAACMSARIAEDRERNASQLAALGAAEERLDEKQRGLEELERRIFCIADGVHDVVELNVGGQLMSTTRAVLCSAEGSLLAGMFSGNFDGGLKRDRADRIFLDVDPALFARVLSHLRLRRIASPEFPAPLPQVPEDLRVEYDMMIRYFGLENFMYGDSGSRGNIFQRLAELCHVSQGKLQTHGLLQVVLSSTGGVTAPYHEEVLSKDGFHEVSLENSYGAHLNTITIKFLKHVVRVEAMEMRAKVADVASHMSNQWTFRHGVESASMQFAFSRLEPCTGRLEVDFGPDLVDEVQWSFLGDFCLEHIILYGRVVPQ
mmetsp:Transcript_24336/g.54198  ORF Transcript_24336/g.54198 Transcript_24336/m.54198 type:complete len:326 (-) Transcript_24336:310-1287(-)|eukprot:CAMPEP_0170627532 /NCGR_PEP_ID=MMETSP0224-20130122/32029_1 /TAXON_ID=285029 /ORGANISM="Togula jolla, Strain CCCM 725" /LENGTH=325 /DNA_ID=CAMNT_0010954553 /DNA_START=106 /DNA_END=1083 /DNA_ORIENTATION=+